MLSSDDILALRRLSAGPDLVLSLYLPLEPGGGHVQAARSILSAALLEDPRLKGLGADCEGLLEAASKADAARHAGLAAFSCRAKGFFRAAGLPQPVRAELRAAPAPYLAPFDNAAEHHQRYGLVLAGPGRARFLEAYLGEAVEHPGLEFPPAGPREGTAAVHRRLSAVARRALELVRERGLDRVLLAAPAELQTELIRHLHGRIQDGLILDPALGEASSLDEALERVVSGERESRKVRESVLVYRLLDAARSGGMGVLGLAPTLAALHEGRVRLLLLRQGLARMGRACRHCGALTLSGKKCPYCWLDTEPTVNLVGEMAGKALDQGCEVVLVQHDQRLDACGGAGAELSHAAAPEEAQAPSSVGTAD